jgi:hypothetical protein
MYSPHGENVVSMLTLFVFSPYYDANVNVFFLISQYPTLSRHIDMPERHGIDLLENRSWRSVGD